MLLTFMPSQRETARNGLKARSVRIERNAGISAAPAIVAPKLTSESLIYGYLISFQYFRGVIFDDYDKCLMRGLFTYHYDNKIKPTPSVCEVYCET